MIRQHALVKLGLPRTLAVQVDEDLKELELIPGITIDQKHRVVQRLRRLVCSPR